MVRAPHWDLTEVSLEVDGSTPTWSRVLGGDSHILLRTVGIDDPGVVGCLWDKRRLNYPSRKKNGTISFLSNHVELRAGKSAIFIPESKSYKSNAGLTSVQSL